MKTETILGIDYGEKRIGLALASMVAKIASPLATIANSPDVLSDISEITERENVQTIVVGLPRDMQGQDTAQTKITREFISRLASAGYNVIAQDEAATSVKARDELNKRGKPYGKEDVDKLAATYILNDYLESV